MSGLTINGSFCLLSIDYQMSILDAGPLISYISNIIS
jgi:hypothetical protein